MAAEKTHAVVLRVLPYRESSLILHLFTERHGLMHGIAKGVRGPRSTARSLERGVLVETIVYVKPHRDLHTLGAINLLETHPATRADLVRAAMRDVALETFLTTVTATEYHPELYECLASFLRDLDNAVDRPACFARLWAFFLAFASLLGFALRFDACVVCGTALASGNDGGALSYREGGVVCRRCGGARAEGHLPPPTLARLRSLNDGAAGGSPPAVDEGVRVTRALATYCRYHFGVEPEFRSLGFLEEVARLA